MKQLPYLFALSLSLSCLFSCSPKIVTNVMKNYPPVDETEEVVIYEREKDDHVPATAETIGSIAVVDNGFSVGGSYEKVIDMASVETRKNGGNGLLITDHIKPSFWGSTIHQIAGTMLKVDPNDTTLVSSKVAYTSIRENNERKRINIPEHIFGFNIGYGGLPRSDNDVPKEIQDLNDKLTNGIVWDAHYYYHHKGLPYGFGVLASQYYSSPFQDVTYQNNKNNIRLDYVGLSLALRHAFSPKWMWNLNLGMGYLGLMQKASDVNNSSNFGTRKGNTFGSHFGIGIEHRISKQLGIGVDFSSILGYLTSVEDNNFIPDPSTPEINDKNRLNVSRSNAAIGIRYYIQ